MISSPTVKLQTFEVDNLIWFKSESITWDKQNDLTIRVKSWPPSILSIHDVMHIKTLDFIHAGKSTLVHIESIWGRRIKFGSNALVSFDKTENTAGNEEKADCHQFLHIPSAIQTLTYWTVTFYQMTEKDSFPKLLLVAVKN